MKDFRYWGVKSKVYPELGYRTLWYNLNTIRFGATQSKPLPPEKSEFYDISLGTKCNMSGSGCEFCYASASKSGINYSDVCKKAQKFFGSMEKNDRPLQISVGSGGEPTIHPEFCDFLETIFYLGIVPNYTTNGLTLYHDNDLAEKILKATENYCAGVAVSANSFTEPIWRRAVEKLSEIDVYINLNLIIDDIDSVDRFFKIYNEFRDKIHAFILLPLVSSGRSNRDMTPDSFKYLLSRWTEISDKAQVAFGAHYYKYLKDQDTIKCYLFEPESFSKNLILANDYIKITPSSFDTTTILWKKQLK